jgi:hypothetical protein
MGRQPRSRTQGRVWICRILPGRSKWPHRTPKLTGGTAAESRGLWAGVVVASQAIAAGCEGVRASGQRGDQGGVWVLRVDGSAEVQGWIRSSHREVP